MSKFILLIYLVMDLCPSLVLFRSSSINSQLKYQVKFRLIVSVLIHSSINKF